MTSDARQALARLSGRLLRLVLDDPQVRHELDALANALLGEHAAAPPAESVASPVAEPAPAAPPVPAVAPPAPRPRSTEPLPELTLGRTGNVTKGSAITYDPTWMPREEPRFDIDDVIRRCRLKAEAARYVAERACTAEADLAGPSPRRAELLSAAATMQPCYLWMLNHSYTFADAPDLAGPLAESYQALAEVLEVVKIFQANQPTNVGLRDVLELLAEAQSAMRAAFLRLGQDRDDDQVTVYNFVRDMTKHHRVYIARYMRAEDQADPNRWQERLDRAHALRERLEQRVGQERALRKKFDNLRYKLSRGITDERIPADEWPQIAQLVDEVISLGLPPSNVELREALLPVIDQLPHLDDLPDGFAKVLDAIDQYRFVIQARSESSDEEADAVVAPQVAEVAELLAGKAVVLIGGEERPHVRQALIDALGLSDLYWISTRPHESIASFEPYVRRPDVAVVLLAIRWSSHAYGEVHRFCKLYGKPLVRLPRGCNPNQVAAEILRQRSRQLAGA